MKRLLLLPLLFIPFHLSAQRASKGQNALALYGGIINSYGAFSLQAGYSHYRISGTFDFDLYYNSSELTYRNNATKLNKYIFLAGYNHRLLQNYKRTLLLYAGAGAAIGYAQTNGIAQAIELATEHEVIYGLAPTVRLDWFICKQLALTAKAEDLLYIGSTLDQNDLMFSIGLKYIIK